MKERGVSVTQVAKDLGISQSVVGRWVREASSDPKQAFPGRGQMKPDDAEVARLKRELAKTKAERDIKKNHRHRCGIHRVERPMRREQLIARRRRRRMPFDIGPRLEHSIAPNVLKRRFAAAAPNRKWVADFTYLWTAEGWLYVVAVMNLFFQTDCGLVDELADDRTTRHGRDVDGDLAQRPGEGAAPPLEPA